jgi:K+-transporting ATPase ATPase A chain
MQAFQREELLEILIFFLVLLGLGFPIGKVLGQVLKGELSSYLKFLRPVERATLQTIGVNRDNHQNPATMGWREYFGCVIGLSLTGLGVLTLILRYQNLLPLNPQNFGGLTWLLSLNTAVSFVTNTNWQAYSGEAQLSYFSQMVGLGVQNFVSAAVGIAIMAALARGLISKQVDRVGNFWEDITRVTVYILLPLSLFLAIGLISQGVIQNFSHYQEATSLEGIKSLIPGGPAASQIAIKQLGTNGGGFFGVNSAHPFENPTPLSNFLQLLSILLLPLACVIAFGELTLKKAHSRALVYTMFVVFIPVLVLALWSESSANFAIGNLPFFEGKETRFGIGSSTLWEVATTLASNGSVNAMHDSFSPLAGMVGIFNMMLGEVIFGGVGSGVYGLVLFVVLAVFLAGLMVGRSPEYFGKKIESKEVVWAAVGVLAPGICILLGTTLSLLLPEALGSRGNLGPHGLSEILYAFTSASANNGSAFGGLTVDTPFYNMALSFCMLVGRFVPILAVLQITASLSLKKIAPESLGTFPTSGGSFVLLLTGVVIIIGALTFLPVLALGPLAEHFLMQKGLLF